MLEKTSDIIGKVYRELGIRSELDLPYQTIEEQINDTVRGYLQDMNLAPRRESRTGEAPATITPSTFDHQITVDGIDDFDLRRLLYSADSGNSFAACELVSYDVFDQHSTQNAAIACLYGGIGLSNGLRIKFNQSNEWVSGQTWKAGFRVPLIALLKLDDAPPIPSDFVPMLSKEVAFNVARKVRNGTSQWREWKNDNLPLLKNEIDEWKIRWERWLRTSIEPNFVTMPRYDDYRRGSGGRRSLNDHQRILES